MLHPRRSAQDVLLCDLCETVPLQNHCELCKISLCTNCVGKHLSDSSKRHNVLPFTQRKSSVIYPQCPDHPTKHCEMFCEKCDIPVCSTCITSGQHKGHDISEVLEKFGSKTKSLQEDLEELEARIYPRYEEMIADVQNEKSELETNYGDLTIAADQRGEILHREVTAIVNQRKYDIEKMKSKHLSILDKSTDEISNKITELRQIIQDLKNILDSNDVTLTSTYKSRNTEFRTLPSKVTLPSFSSQRINTDQLNEMFGSLSSLSIITKEREYAMRTAEAVSIPSAPVKQLVNEPLLAATIGTGYDRIGSVSCLTEEQVWTCGDSKTMKLLNLQGKLLTSLQTESGKIPQDLAVTRDGDLIYTDYNSKTVNLVRNEQIHAVISLQGWRPTNVCSTSTDDLLVTLISDAQTKSKVVRYSGSIETQTIQFDDQRRPLYSSGPSTKYISENRNLDIYVSDSGAKAVVVVKQSGKLRFRYTGHPSDTKKSFKPIGIITDSQSHILTADYNNGRIHILDEEGQFLRYIKNCDLHSPYGLCVDIRDNLFVAELNTAKVKKIHYLL